MKSKRKLPDPDDFNAYLMENVTADLKKNGYDTTDPFIGELLGALSQATFPDFSRSPSDHTDISTEELLALPDEELCETIFWRLDGGQEADPHRELFRILYEFDMEIQNGGLCQFFINSLPEVPPSIGKALEAVGAEQHKALYEGFARQNGIDLSDLSSFALEDVEDYGDQFDRYPFDDFDDAYMALTPLFKLLAQYVRLHMEAFA